MRQSLKHPFQSHETVPLTTIPDLDCPLNNRFSLIRLSIKQPFQSHETVQQPFQSHEAVPLTTVFAQFYYLVTNV